jgi:hypothetical protein
MIRHRVAAIALGLSVLGAAAPAQTSAPTRLRGTIAAIAPGALTVATTSGAQVEVALTEPLTVFAVVRIAMSDIKPGSNVGIASLQQADGSLRAVEVTLIPPGRPVNQTNSAWDLAPNSRMTNGAVNELVTATDGRTLTVNYGAGEQKIVVPDNAPVVTLEPADRAMLTPGAHVLVFARKAQDGSFDASRIAVGKDGLTPPM